MTIPAVICDPIGPLRGLLLALHGFTETGPQMRAYAGLDVLAADGWRVVYPTAPGHFWQFHSTHWTRDCELLATLRSLYGGPAGTPIVIAGFSAGACMANTLAALWPARYDAVISYAGYLAPRRPLVCQGQEALPDALVMRNAADELVGSEEVAALVNHYRAMGVDVDEFYPDAGQQPGLAGRRGHFWSSQVNPQVRAFLARLLVSGGQHAAANG